MLSDIYFHLSERCQAPFDRVERLQSAQYHYDEEGKR